MTTKNLSRKLCEICGIEAKVKYVDCGTPECLQEPWAKCEICPEAQPLEFYPDFTQPENFVKLFNLKINNNLFSNTLAYFITSDSKIADTKDFLIVLFNILKSVEECKVNKIKQAIKSEVWKYD